MAVLRAQGYTAQDSFDRAGELLDDGYNRLESIRPKLLLLERDEGVAKYTQCVLNIISANLHWSLRGKRYFEDGQSLIRGDRTIDVLRAPPFLGRLVQ